MNFAINPWERLGECVASSLSGSSLVRQQQNARRNLKNNEDISKNSLESIYFSTFNKRVRSINHQPLNVNVDKIGQRQEVDDISTVPLAGVRSCFGYAFCVFVHARVCICFACLQIAVKTPFSTENLKKKFRRLCSLCMAAPRTKYI